MFVSGTPLSIVEQPAWVKFFKTLRPAFQLPTRKTVSKSYLDTIYNEMQANISVELNEATTLHLQLNGWSNIRNEGIINFIINKPEPRFVSFLDTTDNRHTSEYIKTEIINVMKMYDTSKFFVLIGDNASNMQKAFKLVKNEIPHVEGLGCIAHSLHLLFNDICKSESISNLKKTCQLIVRSIKGSQVLLATLKKHGTHQNINVALKLPVTTRWGSFLFCLESLTKNKGPLQALAIDNNIVDTLKKEIKNVLFDDSFWGNVTGMVDILTPIVHAIHIVESNKPMIHKVFNLINDVENTITDLLFTSPLSWDETLLVKENILSRKDFI